MILEICLVLLAIYVLIHYKRDKENLPPGPRGYPFLGSFPYYRNSDFENAKKKYGNLFMTRTGAFKILYITDFKLTKEAYSKEEFSGRLHLNKDEKGIISSNGDHWVFSRRFLLRHLRDLGMGKSKMEGLIMREVEDLIEDFKKLTNEPSKLPLSINIAVLNMIWQLVASYRYDFNDSSFEDFFSKLLLSGRLHRLLLLRIPQFFPLIEKLVPKSIIDYFKRKTNIYEMRRMLEDYLQPFIDDHLKTLDPNNPRDFIDDYLIEMRKTKSEEFSRFSRQDLLKTSIDLFVAGVVSTSTLIQWFITYMAKFTEIQEKIQLEIDRNIPRDTLPGLEHKDRLSYLEATINEIQRHVSLLFTLTRWTTKDTKLGGYDIPKNTLAIAVAGLIHKDPTYFKDPEEFDPSRFLDKNGKYTPTCDGFQAFGIGKRQCVGEQLSRMELYLVAASLLQNFTFGPPEEGVEISIEKSSEEKFRFPLKDQKFSIKFRK